MRRLIGLLTTICLRMTLLLTVLAWLVSRYYYCHADFYSLSYRVTPSAIAARYVTPPPDSFSVHVVPREETLFDPYASLPTKTTFQAFAAALGMRFSRQPDFIAYFRTIYQIAVRHETLISLALFGNLLHVVVLRRRRKLAACDD